MGNRTPAPLEEPGVLTPAAIRAMRDVQTSGISRRTLLRRSIGGGIALWIAELTAGTLGFLWPNLAGGFGGTFVLGNFATVANNPAVPGAAFDTGAPAYFQDAKTYLMLVDPSRPHFIPGANPYGDGASTNVRTLYQACTHLGCKPNFCPKNYWFECPCHGSRYDRLGIKVLNLGPAPRSLDRFASTVDSNGVLTVDTGKLTLGPLPIALGQPGLIPALSPIGCL